MPIAVAILVLAAFSSVNAVEPTFVEANIAKIAVFQGGRITLNGREAAIDEVRAAFATLARAKGVVWYYREGAKEKEPHPNAMRVMEAIVDAHLPVSMTTKSDFSDVVLQDGSTRPR